MDESILDPFNALIKFYATELFNECVINLDSSNFWDKANEHIFGESLVSFRSSVETFIKALIQDKDMYNYFAQLIIRAYSYPITKTALKEFGVAFDEVTKDKVFGGGFDYSFGTLTRAEQLLLFFSVHRDQISLALDAKKQEVIRLSTERRNHK